ncbi:hypothetical protein JK364_53620 [Streptomyces sp. 110]|uniref:Uncharacterized protein n=1 Tax=Streptomyces endocoffeicus TaxID=2898945 RepID=A0ABS1Q8L3_9ACTN|nr:hypothetical protein [Streptomyces endocoffeicus]MBL1121013.1 hypothetical protein [Streptomyces endocoffeicus]
MDSGDGWMLHAGDAYFFHGEVDRANLRSTPGLRLFQFLADTERGKRLRNQHRLLELARESGDEITIFSAHDPVELRRHESATPPWQPHQSAFSTRFPALLPGPVYRLGRLVTRNPRS